jgi:hypothetical protein
MLAASCRALIEEFTRLILVVLSDGNDNESNTSFACLIGIVLCQQVTIDTVSTNNSGAFWPGGMIFVLLHPQVTFSQDRPTLERHAKGYAGSCRFALCLSSTILRHENVVSTIPEDNFPFCQFSCNHLTRRICCGRSWSENRVVDTSDLARGEATHRDLMSIVRPASAA